MAFRNLWLKETRSMLPLFGIFALLVVFLHGYVWYKGEYWDSEIIFVVSIVMPAVFLGAITLGAGYYQLYTEWRSNSVYLLLSLPVRGWKVLTSKLAAIYLLAVVSMGWIGVSFGIFVLNTRLNEWQKDVEWSEVWPTLLNVGFNTAWMICLAAWLLLVIIQFIFLCGRLVPKLRWLVELMAFMAVSWVIFRISPPLAGLLQWTPDIFFGGGESESEYLHSGPFIVLLLSGIGLTRLNGYIFEKEVEV